MAWGDAATWVGSVAAVVAAAASVSLWRRSRPAVDWKVVLDNPLKEDHLRVVHIGQATARNVRVRLGSVSDPSDVEEEKCAAQLVAGEGIPIIDATSNDSAEDVAVVVTWRGRFRSAGPWVHRLR